VDKPIDGGVVENWINEHFRLLLEGLVGRYDYRTALVAFLDNAEEIIGDDAVERRKTEFIENDRISTNVARPPTAWLRVIVDFAACDLSALVARGRLVLLAENRHER
jgi:hypothetical protein